MMSMLPLSVPVVYTTASCLVALALEFTGSLDVPASCSGVHWHWHFKFYSGTSRSRHVLKTAGVSKIRLLHAALAHQPQAGAFKLYQPEWPTGALAFNL
jgi:hypothetical protein